MLRCPSLVPGGYLVLDAAAAVPTWPAPPRLPPPSCCRGDTRGRQRRPRATRRRRPSPPPPPVTPPPSPAPPPPRAHRTAAAAGRRSGGFERGRRRVVLVVEPGLPHVLRWHHLGLGWRLVLVGVAEPHRAQEEVGAVNVNTGGHTRDAQLPATQIAMPRTRSATEAATARQFVLSSADLLPIIFNNLGAQALCRSACVNKLWRRMDMDATAWTVLLAASVAEHKGQRAGYASGSR